MTVDAPYDLVWDPSLLKYFVNGEGANLGTEEVSEQVHLYVISNNNNSGGSFDVGSQRGHRRGHRIVAVPELAYMQSIS